MRLNQSWPSAAQQWRKTSILLPQGRFPPQGKAGKPGTGRPLGKQALLLPLPWEGCSDGCCLEGPLHNTEPAHAKTTEVQKTDWLLRPHVWAREKKQAKAKTPVCCLESLICKRLQQALLYLIQPSIKQMNSAGFFSSFSALLLLITQHFL